LYAPHFCLDLAVDNQGSALVVAKTKGGAICGGYNPEGEGGHDRHTSSRAHRDTHVQMQKARARMYVSGWEGVGDERAAIAAFLFTWRDGQVKKQPVKLPKVGPADYAIDDNPALAIKVCGACLCRLCVCVLCGGGRHGKRDGALADPLRVVRVCVCAGAGRWALRTSW
jgi:hypothetical protein